jgi:hypothetical protein
MKADIKLLEKVADAGSIRQTAENSNLGTVKVYFTLYGVPVSCQYSCDLDGLYGFSIDNMSHLAKIMGMGGEE